MAVVLGTSSGFVTVAPTADPAGTTTTFDGSSVVTKHTSPAGAASITEIGWYRSAGTNGANFEVALYADSAGVADTRLFVDNTNSDTAGGWVVTTVSWAISENTDYWLGLQMDAHSGNSGVDRADSGGAGSDILGSQTTLDDPYGGGAVADADGMYAIYAKYSSGTVTTDKTQTGVSRIQQIVDKAQTGVSRVQKTVDQTVTGVSRIQKTVDQTIAGVANITTTTTQDKTQTGVSRITATTDRTQTGRSRIQKSVDQTISGTARVQKIVDSTIGGLARIQKTEDSTITGKANIQNTTDRTITGKAAILKTVDQTITGVASIVQVADKTITGKASIAVTTDKTITGLARITATTDKTITGKAKIEKISLTKATSFALAGDLSKSIAFTGNTLPLNFLTNAPSGTPVGGKGVVFRITGGVVKVYVWDGSTWISS